MRILFLTDINSAHSQKWIRALADKGLEIGIFTLSIPNGDWYKTYANIEVFDGGAKKGSLFSASVLAKFSYLGAIKPLKKCIKNFKPQLVHAHYATSYGLLGRLSRFHPFVISAWGSDVMEFPSKGAFFRRLLRNNFKHADLILATSPTIANAIQSLGNFEIKELPFGIDLVLFTPQQREQSDKIVIGTIKSLEHIYATDILIRAFEPLAKKYETLHLLLVGGGTQEAKLKQLAADLKLENRVTFQGKVPYDEVPQWHNRIDIFTNISRNESFGVAVLEAAACEKPVIATRVGGLQYLVKDGETGFLVEKEHISDTTDALEKLIQNPELRLQMGKNARIFVAKQYDFQKHLEQQLEWYNELINKTI